MCLSAELQHWFTPDKTDKPFICVPLRKINKSNISTSWDPSFKGVAANKHPGLLEDASHLYFKEFLSFLLVLTRSVTANCIWAFQVNIWPDVCQGGAELFLCAAVSWHRLRRVVWQVLRPLDDGVWVLVCVKLFQISCVSIWIPLRCRSNLD